MSANRSKIIQVISAIVLAGVLSCAGIGAALGSSGDYVRVVAVGDVMMGSTYPTPILPYCDGNTVFEQVYPALRGGDIVFGNLEGPFIDGGTPRKCGSQSAEKGLCYEFRVPVRYINHLKRSGFTAVNIANNHINDFGPEGVKTTLGVLKAAGIKAIGGKENVTFYIKGKKVAMTGFSFGKSGSFASILDMRRAAEIIRELKRDNEIVIVSFHGGAEGANAMDVSDMWEQFAGEPRGNVVKFSRTVIDAGADLVLGHGPHVLRPMELYKGKLIVYSLGNFLTYGRFNIRGPSGLSVVLRADIDRNTGNLISGQLVPLRLRDRGIPSIDVEGQSIRLVKESTEKLQGKGNLLVLENGHFYPSESLFGIFFSGGFPARLIGRTLPWR